MTQGLHLIVANRLEELADALAELVQAPPPGCKTDPLVSETILVQSKGMQRWLSLTLADRNGICANVRFPFPNAFLEFVYDQLGGQLPQPNPFDPDMLAFRILAMLPDLVKSKPFRPLKTYLGNGNQRPLKAYQLARKIGETFDHYQVYRPDLLSAWEKGNDHPTDHSHDAWQPELWRRLTKEPGCLHRARLNNDLLRRLVKTKHWPVELPLRLAVFGVSYLPPVHLAFLQTLAGRVPVYLFLLNPCREFWFDIVSEKQISRIEGRAPESTPEARPDPESDMHLETGNGLLASWGKLGRHFFSQIYQFDCESLELFNEPAGTNLLARLQQDILQLKETVAEANTTAAIPVDGSIRIHACHSVMREIEVLHDQLLDIFEQYPHIQPRDIMVLTPDISTYAPFVHAVFGTGGLIPFSVTDQRYMDRSHLIEGFSQMLGLATSRFELSKIVTLLDNPLICQKFELEPSDLPLVRHWFQEANIRWGWDSQMRKKEGLPAVDQNTWRDGLDRLLLGYAMAGNGIDCYAGLLPLSLGEGHERRILGGLISFMETLHCKLASIPEKATLDSWAERLLDIKDCFFSRSEESEYDHRVLDETIGRLRQIDPWFTQGDPPCFEVIRQHLIALLEQTRQSGGFITGGVTFCAALPMRSVPAEVICMVGLNYDSFPREDQEPAFNLMTSMPRIGDRSRRDDDKYLFLETLVSARSVFYLSYIGRDIQDNAPIPPSVLVEELVDYLSEKMGIRREQLICTHPLHAFSPRYFTNKEEHYFSYAKDNLDASRCLSSQVKSDPAPFVDAALPQAPRDWLQCEPIDIISFYENPAKYLLTRRLGIRFQKKNESYEDREPFVLNALENFRLSQKLLADYLAGHQVRQTYLAAKSSGHLPHGTMGRILHQKLSQEVHVFIEQLNSRLDGQSAAVGSFDVDLNIGGHHLSGLVDGFVQNGVIHCRMGQEHPKDLLRTFISHLIVHLCTGISGPYNSSLICKNAIWGFNTVAKADSVMERYLNLYYQGLSRPLPFFPRTSFAYAHSRLTNSVSTQSALSAARRTWLGNDYTRGESQDPYYWRCFGNADPLTQEFEDLAVDVFKPIFSAGRRSPADRAIL